MKIARWLDRIKWSPKLTGLRSEDIDKPKVEVQVQVQVDDWVFIKIAISNEPASQQPTPRESFKEAS